MLETLTPAVRIIPAHCSTSNGAPKYLNSLYSSKTFEFVEHVKWKLKCLSFALLYDRKFRMSIINDNTKNDTAAC